MMSLVVTLKTIWKARIIICVSSFSWLSKVWGNLKQVVKRSRGVGLQDYVWEVSPVQYEVRPWGMRLSSWGRTPLYCHPGSHTQPYLRNVVREQKRDYVGKIPKRRTPSPPPPIWETPVIKKKVGFIFHFRTSGTYLVFTKKSTFWVIDWNYVVGIGEPPLRDARFSIFPKKKTLLSVKIDQISPPPFL